MRLRPVQRHVQRSALHGLFGRESFPEGAILHFDADLDPYTEQTGGPHTFNHAVLSPQYQRGADGSYTDVGAKPAVDTFDGEKWLRSCGAVTNLLASGATDFTSAAWTRRGAISVSLVDGWYLLNKVTMKDDIYNTAYMTVLGAAGTPYNVCFDLKQHVTSGVLSIQNPSKLAAGEWSIDLSKIPVGGERITDAHPAVTVVTPMVLSAAGAGGIMIKGISWPTTISVYIRNPQVTLSAYPVPYTPPGTTMPASNATTTNGSWFSLPDGSELWHALDGGPETDGVELVRESPGLDTGWTNNSDGSFTFTGPAEGNCNIYSLMSSPQVYGKYKVTYRVVNNTFQSNNLQIMLGTNTSQKGATSFTATMLNNTTNVINASSLRLLSGTITIDNISIQRIQPQPLTLATRVRMGLAGSDYPRNLWAPILAVREVGANHVQDMSFSGCADVHRVVRASCNETDTVLMNAIWPRNAIIRRVTQVNTAGTQFRVGYMIEGTHTAIQWSAWKAYDGSFDPSALYRLMLGFNNPYPMWYNKITAWKKQATDAEILEAMA